MLSWVTVSFASAQTLADGLKAVYYEKYKTANDIFSKLVAANPADADANYWLGQVAISQPNHDLALARNIYTKALVSTNLNPLIMVGMGHVELMEGKAAESKTRFIAALAATDNKKGGDPKILVAVGRANADGDSKTGEAEFAIEKLNTAAKLDVKDPDIFVLEGISHLKRGREYGGDAKKAFEAALERDPKYAKAKYRIARIFMSQNSKEFFLPMLEEATQMDPAYGPAWLALYDYYSERDVNKAREYMEKYLAVSDKDCETDFFYADYLLRSGKHEEALANGKLIEANCGGDNFPKVYKLYAMVYERSGDSVQSRDNFSKYILKEKPAKIVALDYSNYAAILARFPNSDTAVEENMNKAFALDTSIISKVQSANEVAAIYAKANNFCSASKWYSTIAAVKPIVSAADFYYWGDAVTKCMNAATDTVTRNMYYQKADSIYAEYAAKYPEQVQPYSVRANAAKLYDTDTSRGTAVTAVDAYTKFLMHDTLKNKENIIRNYYYVIPYFAKVKAYDKALEATKAILSLEPTNEYALRVKEILMKSNGGLKARKEKNR